MYPEIFGISFLHTYGVLVAVGFLAAVWMASRLAGRGGLDSAKVIDLGVYCALSALAGAKLMMILVDAPYYAQHPREIFTWATIQAGGVFYGGLIAALGVSWWYLKRSGLPPLATSDAFAPAIALGHGIGRIGCFTAGCCWGVACDRPWAVTFKNPVANQLVGVPLGIPLHPTELYEAAAEFAIFAVLYRRFMKPHPTGSIIALYLMLYPAARFLVEFYRFHEQGNLFGGPLDSSQWISLILVAVGAMMWARSRKAPLRAKTTR